MYPKLYINSTNLLTQKQQQEIAELTTFCRHHDGIDLSYPSEEEDLTHFLAYLPDRQRDVRPEDRPENE